MTPHEYHTILAWIIGCYALVAVFGVIITIVVFTILGKMK